MIANGKRVRLIGDPHLGKKFEAGVPSHRRGEREMMQAGQFAAELDADADIIVMVGDLFDNPSVSREVVLTTARAVLGAAERNEDTMYFMMAGNHDQPRSLGTVGAWPLFKKMVEHRLPNLRVVDRPAVYDAIAMFPWEWDRTALQQVADVADAQFIDHAIGHWDTMAFDGKDDHLVPVAALREAFGEIEIWTGHIHTPGVVEVDGYPVTKTGSMQPYAHGEGDLYVTLTTQEALARDDLRDKCVRILLAPGETMPEIDCLALTHKREAAADTDEELTVSVDDFDFHRIVRERIEGRDPAVVSFIEERMSLNAAPSGEDRSQS